MLSRPDIIVIGLALLVSAGWLPFALCQVWTFLGDRRIDKVVGATGVCEARPIATTGTDLPATQNPAGVSEIPSARNKPA